MSLHRLVGHESVRASLATAFAQDSLPHSLLLHGPRGIGKQHLALWLARLVVCNSPGTDGPCDGCGPCRMSLSLEHPDVHWYFPLARPKGLSGEKLKDALERDRHLELAEVRAQSMRASWSDDVTGLYLGTVANIRSRAHKRPTMADGPIFIVGQAESLVPQEASPEAANALLKMLEEPPGGARFILTSSEPGRLLPTIRSRTVPLHVSPLPREVVRTLLEEYGAADADQADWAAGLAQGSPGRALAFLPTGDRKGPLEELRRKAYTMVTAATGGSRSAGYAVAMSFPPSGARKLIDLFTFVEEWLRDLAAVAAGAEHIVIHEDALESMRQHVRRHSLAAMDLTSAFSAVERARELARGNVNPQLVVSGLIRDMRAAPRGTPALAGGDR